MNSAQLEIFEIWRTQYKPKLFPGLLENTSNAEAIGEGLRDLFDARMSVVNLNAVVEQLSAVGKLEYHAVKQQPQFAEKVVEKIVYVEKPEPVKSAKQLAREQREAAIHLGVKVYGSDRNEFDRQSPQRIEEDKIFNNNVRAHNQLLARHNIDRAVANYMVVSPSGRTDHAKTHQRREVLRQIKIMSSDSEQDYIATLEAVLERINKFEKGNTDYDSANLDFRGNRR